METQTLKHRPLWTLNKLIAAGVVASFAFLLLEIRFEHREVISEHWQSWIPIAYSGAALLLGVPALAWWQPYGRQVLHVAFGLALIVGLLGVWFHTEGHPARVLAILSVWLSGARPIPLSDTPPALAPLAFFGLGALGVAACSRRFPAEADAAEGETAE